MPGTRATVSATVLFAKRGIWTGREVVLRRPEPADHGTNSAYVRGCSCFRCRVAHATYQASHRAALKARSPVRGPVP